MTTSPFIPPTHLRDYAKSRGWVMLPEAIADRRYVLSHPHFAPRQLVFPMDTLAPDYAEAIARVVDTLATLEQRPLQNLWDDLASVGDDFLSFRVLESSILSLGLASDLVTGVQQLLLTGACSVLKPQPHHPRLSRTEAQQLLDATQFRHTRPGSFVFNVSCPVHALDVQAPLLADEEPAPFVRRTTHLLYRALSQLVGAIESDTVERLVETASQGSTIISSNLCEALTRLTDDTHKNSIEIGFRWAAALPPQKWEPMTKVRIQRDYFSRIEEVQRALRVQAPAQGVFPATVERLNGEMGPDNRRAGEVILSLFTPEGTTVMARAQLTAERYAHADKAHMTAGAFVRVAGYLHPGRQPRTLVVESFEPMNPAQP